MAQAQQMGHVGLIFKSKEQILKKIVGDVILHQFIRNDMMFGCRELTRNKQAGYFEQIFILLPHWGAKKLNF